jgi:tetratricopeptide (TPR) repeat protein
MTDEPRLKALDDGPGPALALSPSAAAAQADELIARLRVPRRVGRLKQAGVGAGVVAVGALALLYSTTRPQPTAAPSQPVAPVLEAPAANAAEVSAQAPPDPATAARAQSTQPEDWLGHANAARAKRDFARAEALYRMVVHRYPESDDAMAARLAAADLQVQQLGRAQDAVALYRELIALRPNGALVEQARVGLAHAWMALGNRVEERTVWNDLLRAAPHSLFAQEARARLKAL